MANLGRRGMDVERYMLRYSPKASMKVSKGMQMVFCLL